MNYGKKRTRNREHELASKGTMIRKKFNVIFCKALLICFFAVVIVGGCSAFGVISGIIASAPSIEDIDATPTGYLTTVLDNQGNQTATLVASGSNRKYVTINEIPINLQHAFVAIEDERFYQHNGIDIMGILRAGVTAVKTGFKRQEGASTITQQLAKNELFTQEKQMARKAAEMFAARDIEDYYSKQQIFEMYANTIYFGSGYYGIAEAAEGYFGKEPAQLTDTEAIYLAGMPNAPSTYASSPELAFKRMQVVLKRMVKCRVLTQQQADAIAADAENLTV